MDRDWILIGALGTGWGTSFFFNEILLREMGPLTVSFSRVAMAAITGWVYLIATGRSGRVPVSALGALAVLGGLMFATPFAVYPIGQQYVASGVAGIVNALTPVMVVVISHLWPGGEKATWLKSLGVVAGFLGIVFLTIPALNSGERTQLFGTLIILLAPICYACAMNWMRILKGMDMKVMATWAFTFGSLLLLPLILATEGFPRTVSPVAWLSVFFLGVVLTGISFLVAFTVLPRAGATKTSTATFIAPVSALIVGWLALGERLGPSHFLGMATIFAGLLLIDGSIFRKKLN